MENSNDTRAAHRLAACALVRDSQGRVLLVRHRLRGWDIPGGHVEAGEDLVVALQREVAEETGLGITVGPLAGVYCSLREPSLLILCFLAGPVSGELRGSLESPDLGWFQPGQVLELVSHPVLRDRIRDLLEFSGHIVYRAYRTEPYEIVDERTLS